LFTAPAADPSDFRRAGVATDGSSCAGSRRTDASIWRCKLTTPDQGTPRNLDGRNFASAPGKYAVWVPVWDGVDGVDGVDDWMRRGRPRDERRG